MTQNGAKKIGLFSALSICVGSIVGIGIFLKNHSVAANVQGNGTTWILTWAVAGLIALLVAIHFGKISKIESEDHATGISFWSDQVTTSKTKWFHKIVAFNYGFFYLSVLTIALSFFTTELLINFIKEINSSVQLEVWAHVLISLGFMAIFVVTNFLSHHFSGWISSATLVLKFIPLIAVVVIGIIFANTHNTGSENNPDTVNGFLRPINGLDAMKGMMLSIPSVLFAFDAFIGVGALSKQIKGGDKSVSKIIVFGMIFVTIIYLLISISSALHYNPKGTTFISDVLKDALPKEVGQAISTFVSFFLFVSAYGTSNAIVGVGVKEFENVCQDQRFAFTKKLNQKFGAKKGGLILESIVLSFWSLLIFIPSIILKTDALIDGFSNLAVVYFFVIYTVLIFFFWKNKYLKESEFQANSNKIRYSILVWTTIVAVSFAVLLNFIFIISDGIQKTANASSWGLFLTNEEKVFSNLNVVITYLVVSPLFFGLPFLNAWIKVKLN